MGWTNYHGHCKYCDGHGEIKQYIDKAIELGMPILGVSSHAPVPFDCFWTMKLENLEKYNQELLQLQAEYKDKIVLLRSLEVDYVPTQIGPDVDYVKALNLDYIIGSIHFINQLKDGTYWAIDGSFEEFKLGLNDIFKGDIKAVVREFYRLNREMIELQSFDMLGHFDKIKMHNVVESLFDENADWYKSEVIETLHCAVKNDVIVEINTKSFKRNGLLFPGKEWFKVMHQMGVKVTINSDAHFAEKLVEGFEEVAYALAEAGYTELFEYISGRWQAVSFSETGINF